MTSSSPLKHMLCTHMHAHTHILLPESWQTANIRRGGCFEFPGTPVRGECFFLKFLGSRNNIKSVLIMDER